MEHNSYLNDLKKIEYKLNELKRMYVNAQQIEEYVLADDIKNRIDEVENEFEKLKSLR